MRVQFKKITSPGWRYRGRTGAREWADPFASAVVDGQHTVTVTPKRGWRCTCPDLECGHVDAVAELIHPHTLALLEGDRKIPAKEKQA